ncbi:MAG: DUF805 domain-containing protein [Bacilli bacterium]|nr:DUF805 domain-containing protein [Bacilli bacterium]
MRSFVFMWKRLFDFQGTTTVGEFWVAIIFDFIVQFLITYALMYFLGDLGAIDYAWIYPVLSIIPKISMTIRRIRDADRSPANILWAFVPFIGWLVLLMVLFSKSRAQRDRDFDRYHW